MKNAIEGKTLYLIATPIGNLSDITGRATDVLGEVDILYAEDTRVARQLLSHLGIARSVLIYNQYSAERVKNEILLKLIEGNSVGVITDAGTPGISDPGNELVSFITQHPDVRVSPIPGVSALTTALSVCGFPVTPFLFIGFLPKSKRLKLFESLKGKGIPVVFFDSPFRILKTLKELNEFFGGDTAIYIGRELTKMYETHYRGTIDSVTKELEKSTVKGEIVCVLNLKKPHKVD